MSKLDDKGQPRVKSCPTESLVLCDNECDESEITIHEINGKNKRVCKFKGCSVCDNHECRVTENLDYYAKELEKYQDENAKLKALNTQFRILMLMPSTAETLIEKGELDFSGIKGLISKQRQSWDTCDDTTILYMLEYHQKFAEAYGQFAHERNSKIRIKEVIAEKAKSETKSAIKKIDQMKAEVKEKKEKLSEFGKAVAGYMKIGMKEDRAKEIVRALGIKE
jgi:hypothetical protein